MFCARSVAGPKRDRMVSSHSRPTTEAFSADFAPALKTLLQATLLAGRLLLLIEHLRALRWPVAQSHGRCKRGKRKLEMEMRKVTAFTADDASKEAAYWSMCRAIQINPGKYGKPI